MSARTLSTTALARFGNLLKNGVGYRTALALADRITEADLAAAQDAPSVPKGSLTAYGLAAHVTVGKTRGVDFCTLDYASDDLAFAAAIASLPVSGFNGGGIVKPQPGTYDFVNGLDWSAVPNVSIEGSHSTIVRWKNSNTFANASAGVNWLLVPGYGSHIVGLNLRGSSTFTCPINGVNTFNAGGGTNTRGGGIKITNGRTWLDRVYVTGMAEDGIANVGGIGTKWSDVQVIGCGGTGVNITGTLGALSGVYATDEDLVSVMVASCGVGMSINVGGIWVSGAHVWGCQGDGILVNSDVVRLANCYVESNAGWGINLNGKSRCVISGNDVWGNGLSGGQKGGIQLAGASMSNFISGNQLRDNRFFQILLAGTSAFNVVNGNVVTDSFSHAPSTPTTAISYTSAGTVTSGSATFSDSNNPAWITTQNAVGLTLSITGAGAASAALTTQVTAWSNPSPGVYQVTLALAAGTTVANPTYAVHANAYGIRETSTGGRNNIYGNSIPVLAAAIQCILLAVNSGSNSSSRNNAGVNLDAWSELGTISSGTIGIDLRNGVTNHATISANVTTVSSFGTSSLNRNDIVTVSITQDATGGRTVTGWASAFSFDPGKGTPTWPSGANATGEVTFRYNGTKLVEIARSF